MNIWMYALGILLVRSGSADLATGISKTGLGWSGLVIVAFSAVTTTFLDVLAHRPDAHLAPRCGNSGTYSACQESFNAIYGLVTSVQLYRTKFSDLKIPYGHRIKVGSRIDEF